MVRPAADTYEVLLVRSPKGTWGFPKGHIERGEAPETTAIREVREEAGVIARVVMKVGDVRYFFRSQGTLVSKVVNLFLMDWIAEEPRPDGFEVVEARFWPEEQISRVLSFESDRNVWDRTRAILETRRECNAKT